MAYAVSSDLITRYGQRELIQLTDRVDPPAGAVNTEISDKALADAGDLIDSYISAAYALPISPPPPMVVGLACQIARYLLYVDAPTDKVKADYDAALKFLKDVQAGKAKIPGLDGVEEPGRTGMVLTSEADRTFTRDSLRGF